MAEDQAVGEDARFTVNVDGHQIGGLQTVTASQSAGQTQQFTFQGDFAPGQHVITVTYANNFIYPGTAGDRNVYVDGATYDGQTISSGTTGIYNSPLFPPNSTNGNNYGHAQFTVNDKTALDSGASSSTSPTIAPVSVGSGADTLVLNMAEDPYLGDAQFVVTVDGKQVGGTLTTTANVEDGQSQEFDLHGNFGSGTHTVGVTYLNDQIGDLYPAGTPGLPAQGQWAVDTTDRNLYVMGVSLNGGTPASGTPWEESSNGTQTFTVTSGSNPSASDGTSGLFGSNGAPVDSGNVAITPGSLSAGSSSNMSFVASPTPTPTATTTSTATDTGGSTMASQATPTATPATAIQSNTTSQTAQDFTVPSATGSTTNSTAESQNSGSSVANMYTRPTNMAFHHTHHQG